jgi:hypothetical protein
MVPTLWFWSALAEPQANWPEQPALLDPMVFGAHEVLRYQYEPECEQSWKEHWVLLELCPCGEQHQLSQQLACAWTLLGATNTKASSKAVASNKPIFFMGHLPILNISEVDLMFITEVSLINQAPRRGPPRGGAPEVRLAG